LRELLSASVKPHIHHCAYQTLSFSPIASEECPDLFENLLFGGPARGGGEVGVDMLPELDRVSCVGVEAAVRVELGVEWREDGLYCPALAKLSFR
jgi:hypothetical protein